MVFVLVTMSIQQDINQLCSRAAQLLLSVSRSSRIRVVSHYDADGISAAAVLCHMLYRAGYDFHVSLMRNPFTKGFERLAHEQNELIIFSDMGSGQLDTIERLNSRVIINHFVNKPGIVWCKSMRICVVWMVTMRYQVQP